METKQLQKQIKAIANFLLETLDNAKKVSGTGLEEAIIKDGAIVARNVLQEILDQYK